MLTSVPAQHKSMWWCQGCAKHTSVEYWFYCVLFYFIFISIYFNIFCVACVYKAQVRSIYVILLCFLYISYSTLPVTVSSGGFGRLYLPGITVTFICSFIQVDLPCRVDDTSCQAKWSKKQKSLTLKLPKKP
jgi:hypothetical protein